MGRPCRDFEVYLVHVDPDQCNGCGECAALCQGDVFDMAGPSVPLRPENCLGCRACVAVCRTGAVILTEI